MPRRGRFYRVTGCDCCKRPDFYCTTTTVLYASWTITDAANGIADTQSNVPLTQGTIGNYFNVDPPGPSVEATCVIGPCGGPQQASIAYPELFYSAMFPDPPNAVEGEPYDSGVMTLYRGGVAYGTMRVRS